MPTKSPPAFGSQAYWNERFASNNDPFEWLESPTTLDPYIISALSKAREEKPELLHIGCGTSLLSYHLRSHVDDPDQIHNLDYSDVAIELGKKREHDIYKNQDQYKRDPGENGVAYMRWDAADLLDYKSVLRKCKRNSYSVILDKSTSDSIACGDDVHAPLPYPVAVRSYEPLNLESTASTEPLHPVIVTAVNLALVAKPGARWIALSYSSERFDFLDAAAASDWIPQGLPFPYPNQLWRIVEKHEIDDADWQVRNEKKDDGVAHRPKVCNFVYVLERTDVPLFVRGEHI
ncbi:hypothetical protein P3342_003148 [Pyrenophora teres f. teres]|uniref:Methyltransferase domain-containing protein n=2 Tax=Pyrenophora teres f. teres TaxID=97479 RepID=E3RRR7_PYRTT|nr:hypothetical protein PTT_11532 [Pyrenophora teres f. teres 0-1]KAE8842403.1 hypothetical protein HRS9139_01700 [Pyrenophora teres f. teres]KAE8850534.1 hypothetical protein PTNB85_00950 [Pyrenophora teres f. teres]KAE8851441.1 hypothetical protein HRS9122_01728 [Pyrenophora teres f. teres]KAE8870104.1 hypothetical protein PTNB29_00448 [Pyrenophora teres f. teres]